VIRHTALFVWSDDATEEQKVRVKDGVAYCYYGSEVLTLDFGEDLGLYPSRHGFALMHDHRDREAWDGYNENAAHARVGAILKSLTRPELAARVDWVYAGPPTRRGGVRHLELHRWRDSAGGAERSAALGATEALRGRCPSVRALEVGADLGWYPPNYDWVVEAHFDDVEGLVEFMEHPARQEAAALVSAATQDEITARLQHRMLAG
jgi:hypothetical protein